MKQKIMQTQNVEKSLIDVSATSYPNTMTFGERGSNDNMTRQLFDFFVAFSRDFQGRMVIMPAAGLLLAVGSPAREKVKITLLSPVSQVFHTLVLDSNTYPE